MRALRKVARPSVEWTHLPAPMGGLNFVDAGSAMPATDSVQQYNMIAAEYGLRTRLGSTEWCTGLTGLADNQVRSILPFAGSTVSQNRLFACTSTGIWDVTASSASPTQVLTFGTQTGDAGWGICHTVVTSAGHFLLYADEVNGFYIYTESTGLWTAGSVTGVSAGSLVYVNVFKDRVWFVERDSARAWYLAAGAISGAATVFQMGAKFRAGGSLVGLWNWTYDGGNGMDDSLVAISSGGDVAIYQGTDPASASTFGLKGVWFIGATPAGRRIATNFGGDLLLLSRVGAVPISRLVMGGAELQRNQYETYKISPLFNSLMLSKAGTKGWSLRLQPEDNSLLVTVPTYEGQNTEQLAMALSNKSWGRYRDLPIFSAEAWEGKLYYGTASGVVGINTGYADGRTLADPNSYTPVQWSLLTSFQNLGNGRYKQVQAIRPRFLSESVQPTYRAEAKYDYDLIELGSVTPTVQGGSVWDSGLWDTATWAGEYSASKPISGASGMGVDVAIAMRGTAAVRTILVGMDIAFKQGGFL